VICVAGSVSALIVPRVQLALQHGFIYNLWVTIGLIASINRHLANIDQSWQRPAIDTRIIGHTAGHLRYQGVVSRCRRRQASNILKALNLAGI
jgi:hypothetical protein